MPVCPHCREKMVRWGIPQLSSWSAPFQYVCFNDACTYFVRGWRWMQERYNVAASYRCRIDPATGETGPLPVWSPNALKDGILPEEDSANAA